MGANTPGPRKLFYGVCVCECVGERGDGGPGKKCQPIWLAEDEN